MAYPEKTHVQNVDEVDIMSLVSTRLTNGGIDTELPFIGGWFVFLSYEYSALIEPTVHFSSPQPGLPIAFISRIPAAIIIDHDRSKCIIVACEERKELLSEILMDMQKISEMEEGDLPGSMIHEEDSAIYSSHLDKTHQYIRDGDIFQANLSRLWKVKFDKPCSPVTVYQKLRHSNPAPFAALVKFNDQYIISSSPERLVSVRNGIAETRPIAGTHPRGENLQQDQALSEELLQHPKERAEHVMLIDLERNDLGRVCLPGTIRVKDKMILETYEHVHHIVSSIVGEIAPGKTVKDIVHAVFPGGTITGCPKVRCMQIISEMEQTPRGAYTGSVGYISDHGHMDLNILIRTMVMSENELTFRAGAGIVSDSVTENELNETRHKARGMIHAIQPDH
jgi:anthranilate synthase component 1